MDRQTNAQKKALSSKERQAYFPTEVYQAFMVGYVRRINEATLRVPIGGVRIGSAKHSRLAQINLHTRIITFSRYAIENVPERGRRYLVIHELSHVKEASHNKRFWQLVAEHEPNYKNIGQELERAFHQNVRSEQHNLSKNKKNSESPTQLIFAAPTLLLSSREQELNNKTDKQVLIKPEYEGYSLDSEDLEDEVLSGDPGLLYPHDAGIVDDELQLFDCNEDAFGSWQGHDSGIIHGGY